MSEQWKQHDRACEPCKNCGAELYEKFWGNGGWVPTDKTTDSTHTAEDCVKALKARSVSAPALVLATDVDDMMGVLRCVASTEYTREEVREQAKAALERLKVRGIGDQS